MSLFEGAQRGDRGNEPAIGPQINLRQVAAAIAAEMERGATGTVRNEPDQGFFSVSTTSKGALDRVANFIDSVVADLPGQWLREKHGTEVKTGSPRSSVSPKDRTVLCDPNAPLMLEIFTGGSTNTIFGTLVDVQGNPQSYANTGLTGSELSNHAIQQPPFPTFDRMREFFAGLLAEQFASRREYRI